MIALPAIALLALALAFAYSIGAHYTGACMGMPYAAGAIRAEPALFLMAPLVFLGAALASEGVETTVGHGLLGGGPISLDLAIAIVASALVLTSAYNLLTLPTSTIQILVFSTVGAGLGAGTPVEWPTIERLMLLWAAAPFLACGLGFALVRMWDRRPPRSAPEHGPSRRVAAGLVAVGAAASFAMGANDVSNATGGLIQAGVAGLLAAAVIGGVGLALGALTWGRPLLQRVAFRIVRMDPVMAIASQIAQSAVILGSVAFGLFTSLNQSLVGAMIGTGLARRRTTLIGGAVRDIVAGWALGPVSGLALGVLLSRLFRAVGWL
ncbi:MAG: inorganic phosphate transporter family protein [Thermoplasmata archaeon]|nr:inorganic phosphate transporter family protein [Thermoplasmata archaeon]